MTKDEFVCKTIGKPWSNRACSFSLVDCWGLVVLYYRHVIGKELHHTKDYESGSDFITCFNGEVVFWGRVTQPSDGDIFVAYIGAVPVHVGLVIDGKAYHSRAESSHVRFDKLRTIERIFTKVEYYAYR